MTTRIPSSTRRLFSCFSKFSVITLLVFGSAYVSADEPWMVRVRLASFKYMPEMSQAVAVGVEAPEPGSEEPLRLSNRSFSQSQSVLIDGTLRLFPVGTVNYATAQPICSLKLPKGVSDWMIVIFGSGGENQQYRMIPIVDRDFLMGSFHFLNASKFPIGGIIDGDAFQVPPGRQYNYPNPSKRSDRIRISVDFAYSDQDEWKRLSSSRWTFNPEVRTLMICFWDSVYERLRFVGITDTAPVQDEG